MIISVVIKSVEPGMTDYRDLPKIELHCHLDCSVRISTVAEIGREIGLPLPSPIERALVAPEVCLELADYLSRIDLALKVMQQRKHLIRIARELVEGLARRRSDLWRGSICTAASHTRRAAAAGGRRSR